MYKYVQNYIHYKGRRTLLRLVVVQGVVVGRGGETV